MAATMTAGTYGAGVDEPVGPAPSSRPALRLVGGDDGDAGRGVRPVRSPARRPVSSAVRRRRTTLGLAVVAAAALMVPLSGAGGTSHATGPATAAPVPGHAYVVRAGDTLWSIAASADPSGDPRPLVAQMATQLGTDAVVPGERVVIP